MNAPKLRLCLAVLALTFVPSISAWIHFLDGSTVPDAPWVTFTQTTEGEDEGETIIVDFQEGGTANQAMRLNSGTGAHEWYIEVFEEEEIVVGARFRFLEFSTTGAENIISITTRSKHLAPAPSISLVDGRLKLWTYVNAVVQEQEIMDLGPAEANIFYTVYMFARSDGWVKLWWNGELVYDDYVPLANPYNGYVEWGSGSWQFDATDVIEFDWLGYGTQEDLPVQIASNPPHRAIWQEPSADATFNVISNPELAPGVGADKLGLILTSGTAGMITLSGTDTNREVRLTGLRSNTVYKGMLTFIDLDGTTNNLPFEFDTFATNLFTFEAEDYNFDGGQFMDSVVLSSFADFNNYIDRIGIEGIDHLEYGIEPGETPDQYRLDSLVGTERNKDVLRPPYIAALELDPEIDDFNVTGVEPGEWLNYTRTFPAGTYNLYGRMATDVGGSFTGKVSRVTGATTDQQTASPLGTLAFSPGRGFQTYDYVPLTDTQGNKVAINLNGQDTLRVTATEGTFTANYYMLVPAEAGPPRLLISKAAAGIAISWEGAGFALERTTAMPGGWTAVQNATNPFTVTGSDSGAAFYRLRKSE